MNDGPAALDVANATTPTVVMARAASRIRIAAEIGQDLSARPRVARPSWPGYFKLGLSDREAAGRDARRGLVDLLLRRRRADDDAHGGRHDRPDERGHEQDVLGGTGRRVGQRTPGDEEHEQDGRARGDADGLREHVEREPAV